MAVFGSGGGRSLGGRGPSFGVRFFCYAVICVVLMFYDRKGGWLDTARYGLQAAIYPLQLAVNSPSARTSSSHSTSSSISSAPFLLELIDSFSRATMPWKMS